MNAGIDVPTIQRFGALYIASARLKSMSKWRTIIAAVDVGNPLFYLIAVGIGIGVLVEQGSGTSGTNGIKYIASYKRIYTVYILKFECIFKVKFVV